MATIIYWSERNVPFTSSPKFPIFSLKLIAHHSPMKLLQPDSGSPILNWLNQLPKVKARNLYFLNLLFFIYKEVYKIFFHPIFFHFYYSVTTWFYASSKRSCQELTINGSIQYKADVVNGHLQKIISSSTFSKT